MTTTSHPTPPGPSSPPQAEHRSRRRLIAAAIVVVLLVGGWLAIVRIGLGDDAADSGSVLELSLGDGDALASCLPLDVEILADMSPAFAATATTVDGEQVTLDVTRWYAGGGAETVVLDAPAGMEALIGGITFVPGEQYLITASEGVVNYCGFSGPATPELTAAFDAAFQG